MRDKEPKPAETGREVVLVLRLRPGSEGWWGQVRKVDDGAACYVGNTPQLIALLDQYWQAARAIGERDPRP